MSERRTVKTVLQYQVDQASVKAATDSADQVESAVKGIGDDFTRLGNTATRKVGDIRARFSDLKKGAQEYERSLEDVAGAFDTVGSAASSAGDAVQRGSVFSRVGNFGRDLRALPAVGIPGTDISTDAVGKILQTAGKGLDTLGISIAAAGASALAAGALFVGLSIVINEISKSMAEAAKKAEEYRAGIAAISEALSKQQGTAGIQGLISGAQTNRDALQFQRDFAQGIIDQVNAAVPAVDDNNLLNQAAERQNFIARNLKVQELTNGQVRSLAAFEEGVASLDQQLESADAQLYLYNQQLGSAAVAAQDAAIAQQQAQQQVAAGIQRTVQAQAEADRFAETATLASTAARINAYKDDLAALEDANRALTAVNTEAAQAIVAHNNELIAEKTAAINATEAIRGVVAAREFENGVINRFLEAGRNALGGGFEGFASGFENIISGAIDAGRDIAKVQTEISKAQTDSASKQAEIARTQADAEAKALAELNRAREDAQYELDRDLEDQARDHRQALIDINRRALNDIRNAEGDRDALAAFNAENRRIEEVRTQRRDNKNAIRRLERHFEDQQRVIDRRYAEQLAAAKQTAERATEIERARLQVQVDALNQQLQNQTTAAGLEVQIKQETNNAILAGAVNLRDNIIALFSGSSSIPGSSSSNPLIPTANYVTPAQLYGSGFGQGSASSFTLYSQPTAKSLSKTSSGSGLSINVNMVGQTDTQIVNSATRVFHTELSRTLKAARQKQARAL